MYVPDFMYDHYLKKYQFILQIEGSLKAKRESGLNQPDPLKFFIVQ